jgi:hypothetical protein
MDYFVVLYMISSWKNPGKLVLTSYFPPYIYGTCNGMALHLASCEARKEKRIVEKLEQYVERMERVF